VPFIFLRTEANELWGQFSPDGRWMAYQSNETGRYEIYVRPFPSRGGPILSPRPAALFQTHRLGGGSNVIGRSHQYDVAVDGRFLINVDAELSATPITLLLNWKPY
jgi:hypothetical protein